MEKTERPKVCFDRILPRSIMAAQPVMRGLNGRRAIARLVGSPWMIGSALHVKFMGGTQENHAKVREQVKWWTDVANITIVFDDAPDAVIRVAFNQDEGAWSYIGTECREIPANEPTMNLGFLDGGTAAHEFGHAIGLAHEHQNPVGGIQWNEAVVIAACAKSPNFWTAEETRHNVFEKYYADQIMSTEFDPDSIMVYFFPSSWTLNGFSAKRNDVLSKMDKEFIAGPKMYPKEGPNVLDAVDLKVNAKSRTKGSIGQYGEEDLYKFTTDSDGRFIIDTRGKTNVVMKLFGPDSETALIAEDDDSGVDLNARIVANLIPGTYYIQIRHYDREGGTGEYSVKVSKK
jgi:hypothetical protein